MNLQSIVYSSERLKCPTHKRGVWHSFQFLLFSQLSTSVVVGVGELRVAFLTKYFSSLYMVNQN